VIKGEGVGTVAERDDRKGRREEEREEGDQ
jgi:hypothetical protein